MPTVVVELSGDEAKLLASLKKIVEQNKKTEDSFGSTGRAAKKAGDDAVKEQDRVAAAAKKTADSIEAANKKSADNIFREHEKLLENKERETRQAAQTEAAISRQTAFEEIKQAIRAADEQIKQAERVGAEKRQIAKRVESEQKAAIEGQSKGYQSLVGNVTALVSSYAGLNAVASAFTANLSEQINLQKESLDTVNNIAKAQASTVQNLTGLSPAQKAEALAAAKQLQTEVGFSDQAALQKAVGTGYSASADLPATLSAVKASAELTRLNPEDLADVTTGALMTSGATGEKDARKNLSFMLQAGSQSLVFDPAKLSQTLARSLNSGVNTVPTQDKQEASREIAATFSALNKFAADTKGESTSTAVTTLTAKMEEFFRDIKTNREKLDKKVLELESKVGSAQTNEAEIRMADLDVAKKTQLASRAVGPAKEKADAQLELAIGRRSQLVLNRDEIENARKELADTKKQRDALSNTKDSGTFFGRIEQFQQNEDLKNNFLSNPFGEVAFQGGFRQLLTSGSDLDKQVRENKAGLNFGTKDYNQNVAEIQTLSPELRAATEDARAKAEEQQRLANPERASVATMRSKFESAMVSNRRSSLGGAIDYMRSGFENNLAPANATPEDNANFFASRITRQQNALKDQFGFSPEDQKKVDDLEQVKIEILKMGARLQAPETTASVSKKLEDESIKQTELLGKIADKLPNQGPQPNQIRAMNEGSK